MSDDVDLWNQGKLIGGTSRSAVIRINRRFSEGV